MPIFLDENYWIEQFHVTNLDVDQLYEYIKKENSPLSIEEMAETIVRNLVEREEHCRDVRVYSPEQKYQVAEEIFFLREGKRRYARIIDVIPNRHAVLDSKEIIYDMIKIQFLDDSTTAKFASNCPEHPSRFQGEAQRIESGSNFKTPGQIVTQFSDYIIPAVKNAINEDERFINFGNEWFLKECLVTFYPSELDELHSMISLKKEIPVKNILKENFKINSDDKRYNSFVFSLNCALRDDRKRRFVNFGGESDDVIWGLAPPPNMVSLTLTNEALALGFIKVSSGLKRMLDYYGMGSEVTFVSYGRYEVKGRLDEDKKRIRGQDIKSWYEENRLSENDRIFVKCPEKHGGSLRLYTYHEKSKDEEEEEPGVTKDRIYLRDEIYQTLKSENKVLHYKQIRGIIVDRVRKEVELSSIESTLSRENHLFRRTFPSRGLWGLAEWSEGDKEIDRTSLLLAISEEDWVYRVLKNFARPLETKEIAKEIANRFVISPKYLLETNFINPNDKRLIKLADGFWGLKDWVEEWREELERIEVLLKKIFEQKETLEKIRLEKESRNKRLFLLEENEKKYLQTLDLLGREISMFKEELQKVSEKISKRNLKLSDIKNKIDGLKIQINSLSSKNKIIASIALFSLIALIWMFIWYFKPLIFLFMFLFSISASYGSFNLLKKYKLKKITAVKYKEIEEIMSDLAKLEKEEMSLKDKINQKVSQIEGNKKELEGIDIEKLEIKKSIETLNEQENIVKGFLNQYDVKELVRKRDELSGNLKKIL